MKLKLKIVLDDEQGNTEIKDIIQLEKKSGQGNSFCKR